MQVNRGRKRASINSQPIKVGLSKLWHLSDSFDWMSPLPYPHRRGIILATLLLLIAFFWPSSVPDVQTGSNPATPVDTAATTGQNQPPSSNTAEPHNADQTPAIEPPAQQNTQTALSPPPLQPEQTQPAEQISSTTPADAGQWKEFTVQKGHTLTQLFRDNNYTVSDAFLMARVEGQGRPINELQVGQKIKVRVAHDRQVTALEVELTPNRSALFIRQSNGSFKRER
ncbi:LysM-like peptidoglycan-binding domain-containing protein [Budvicia diplopodorum]|uniref:LysM-like peptidoglycan-binding domain-containing protein n=1 Tax=Budvicia diplopodorum TaxID=1119056 RepID=UPI001356ACFB|nr:LysM-like peptidoglycan-binding domain-containing protein [Budvicia diplopodorum]